MWPIIQAIILGIVEGFTEFLPISSTGHLIVAQDLIGYKDTAELFTVVIQVGAIAAVMWHYRGDLFKRISALFSGKKGSVRFWLNLVIAVIPAGLVGVLFDSSVQKYSRPSTIAIALILGGFVLWFVEDKRQRSEADRPRQMNRHSEAALDAITSKQALGVGVAQVFSLVPGVSRSGSTIVGGLVAGLDRVTATAFSFYLSIPVMILASGYKIIKERSVISQLPGGSPALIAGTVTEFITALFAFSWLLSYVSRHTFKSFAYYRVVFGVVILFLLAVNIL